jgi:hypothetical protein
VPAIYQSLAQIDSVARFHRTRGAVENAVYVVGILRKKQQSLSLNLGGSRNVMVRTKENDASNIRFRRIILIIIQRDSDQIPEACFIYLKVSAS